MEYLLGSLVTLLTMFIVVKLIKHPKNNPVFKGILFSQSRQNELISYSPPPKDLQVKRQSINHFNSKHVKVIINDNSAYWIEDSCLYVAPIHNGIIENEIKKKVDIMAMNKVELDKMIFIVDKLTEGNENDSRNSGK
jgi:hypothetical protein